MHKLKFFAFLVLVKSSISAISFASATKSETAQTSQASTWESDAFFEQFMRDISSEFPELAAANGVVEFWGKSTNLKIENFKQLLEKLKAWVLKTAEYQSKSSNEETRRDLELLLMQLKHWVDGLEKMFDPVQLEDLVSPSTYIKNSLLPYAKNKNDTDKLLSLFLKLSLGNASSFSAFEFFENELRQKIARSTPSKLNFPTKEKVVALLSMQDAELELVRDLVKKRLSDTNSQQNQSEEVQRAFARLTEDRKGWETYIRSEVLQHAKTTTDKLRGELISNLKARGIFYTPEQIAQYANEDMAKLQSALEAAKAEVVSKNQEFKGLSIRDLFLKMSNRKFSSQKEYVQELKSSLTFLKDSFPELTAQYPIGLDINFAKLQTASTQLDLETFVVSALSNEKQSAKPMILLPQIQVMTRQNQDFLFKKAAFIAVARELFPGKYFLNRNIQNTTASKIQKNYTASSSYYQGWGLLALQAAEKKLDAEQRFLMNFYLLYKTTVAHFDVSRGLGSSNLSKLQNVMLDQLGLSGATFVSAVKTMETNPGFLSLDYAGWRMLTNSKVSLQSCNAKRFLARPLFPLIPGRKIADLAACH